MSEINNPRVLAASPNHIKQAAEIIKNGGLVAIPTETVYGLGADAFNPEATRLIYETKGRPGDNPLILHICEPQQFHDLADSPPPYTDALIKKFWPGSLTLVVNKKPSLPQNLGIHPNSPPSTTIAVRMPNHPIALALIKESGCIIAAPSANKAGTPSPTRAEHVAADFANDTQPQIILDGGAADCGVESTVLDITGCTPRILRPGAITAEMIRDAINDACGLDIDAKSIEFTHGNSSENSKNTPRSPGTKYRHYAPKAELTILTSNHAAIIAHIMKEQKNSPTASIGVLASTALETLLKNETNILSPTLQILPLGETAEQTAHTLYANLRKFDTLGVGKIFAEAPIAFNQTNDISQAITDRLTKAAEGRII